jgi:hypothetical protein
MYRDERLALDRVDALRDIEKFQKPADTEGVVRLETLDAMVRRLAAGRAAPAPGAGRMALVDPANGEANPRRWDADLREAARLVARSQQAPA